jgi:hypothetical protein
MLTLALSLSLLFSAPASPASTLPAPGLPTQGMLAPGKHLGGVRLADTQAEVRARWGSRYALCAVCRRTTWLYTYTRGTSGAAVSFRQGKVVAIFTLGVPRGWHTTRGVYLGAPAESVLDVYGTLPWRRCIGYGAVSIRTAGTVSSIYTFGESVYGFALTAPSEPVCQ